MSARAAALEVLDRVEEDGAWIRPTLEAVLSRSGLSPGDRALASELAYGTERWRMRLDHTLERHVSRGLKSVAPRLLRILRLGAYQLLFTRVKPHAAVHETVELARLRGKEPAARFANAVLRSIIRAGGPAPLPDEAKDPAAHLRIKESFPQWLAERWITEHGFEEATKVAAAQNEILPLVARVNVLRTTREALTERLVAEGAQVRPTSHAPNGLVVEGLGDVASSPSFREGWFTVQGESSQLVGDLIRVDPGAVVLDACAAPGGKATGIAERLGAGRVDAVELHRARAGLIQRTAERLGNKNVRVEVADATRRLPFAPAGGYDAALVDAPCSGLGVLRRHPEAKWREGPELIERMAGLQRRILSNVAKHVRLGGLLVYAVCTTTPEETEGVVTGFLEAKKSFALEPVPEGPFRDGDFFRIHAHRVPMDGFFAAAMRRVAPAPSVPTSRAR